MSQHPFGKSPFDFSHLLAPRSALDELLSHHRTLRQLAGGEIREAADFLRRERTPLDMAVGSAKEAADFLRREHTLLDRAGGSAKEVAHFLRRERTLFDIAGGSAKEAAGFLHHERTLRDIAGGSAKGAAGVLHHERTLLDTVGGKLKGIVESLRRDTIDLHGRGLPQKSLVDSIHFAGKGLGVFDPSSSARTNSLSRMAELIDERFRLGNVGGAIVAAGFAGGFDRSLTNSALTAAKLLTGESQSLNYLDKIRTQSLLVDAIAEMDAFARESKNASSDEFQARAAAALDLIVTKVKERLLSANPPERVSLINILNLAVAVFAIIIAIYYGQVTKDAADGGTHDMTQLRAAIERAGEAQLEELRKLRTSVDNVAHELNSSDDEASAPELWVVERAVDVVTSKSKRLPRVAVLYPNQVVSAISLEHKWIRVEYYDYINDVTRVGWVMKKYMRRVNGTARSASQTGQ